MGEIRRRGPGRAQRAELHRARVRRARRARLLGPRPHAASQIRPGDVDWEKVFGEEGARWFHTGGIFCALSETTPLVAREADGGARKYGTGRLLRPELPRVALESQVGGRSARKRSIATRVVVDVMIGNEEDFTAGLGFEVEGLDEHSANSTRPTSRR